MTPQTDKYWRIQTAESHKDIQKHRHRRGLDKYWDFPGIVDLEYGIVSSRRESLSRIRNNLILVDNKLNFEHPDSAYTLSNRIIKGVEFAILGKKGTIDEIVYILNQLGEKPDRAIWNASYRFSRDLGRVLNYFVHLDRIKTNFWWDVENDWMAFLSGDNNINVYRFIEAMVEGQQDFLKRKDKGLLKY